MNKTKLSLMMAGVVTALFLAGCATGRQVKGYVTGVNVAERTMTINGELIHVPKNIRMIKAGTPIALQDVAIGNRVDARVDDHENGGLPDANAFVVLASGNGKEPRK